MFNVSKTADIHAGIGVIAYVSAHMPYINGVIQGIAGLLAITVSVLSIFARIRANRRGKSE